MSPKSNSKFVPHKQQKVLSVKSDKKFCHRKATKGFVTEKQQQILSLKSNNKQLDNVFKIGDPLSPIISHDGVNMGIGSGKECKFRLSVREGGGSAANLGNLPNCQVLYCTVSSMRLVIIETNQ